VIADETKLATLTDSLARRAAVQITRRSLIHRAGRYGIALSLGGVGAGVLASPALADCTDSCNHCTGSCCNNESVFCAELPGWNQNACPPGTCGCGSWTKSYSGCSSGVERVADCCGSCGTCGADCYCPGGDPSCCNHQRWHNGSCDDCNQHVKCRRTFCI
jgi:hypothetical protein